jgi:hypothetical protein
MLLNIRRQRSIPRSLDDDTLHTSCLRCLNLLHVVAEKQPLRWGVAWVLAGNLLVARWLGLWASIDRIEEVSDGGSKVRRVGIGVLEQQLLRCDGTGRVDHDSLTLSNPGGELGRDIGEKGRLQLSGLVAVLPEIALEALQVGDLHVPVHEILHVLGEGRLGLGSLWREGIPILSELGVIPLRLESIRDGLKSVRELTIGSAERSGHAHDYRSLPTNRVICGKGVAGQPIKIGPW